MYLMNEIFSSSKLFVWLNVCCPLHSTWAGLYSIEVVYVSAE